MIQTIDRLVLKRIAQPAVDALQIDPGPWSRKAAQASSSAFVISSLGVAAILAVAFMPFDSLATIVLGASHVVSVRIDAYLGKQQLDNPFSAFGRLFQLLETVSAVILLCYVLPFGSAAWSALICVFVAGLLISDAVAYVSICDTPPPPRRRGYTTPSPAGA